VGLAIGSVAPGFHLQSLNGSPTQEFVSLKDLIALRQPVMLLFTNPDCGPCNALAPEVDSWMLDNADVLTIVRITEAADHTGRQQEGGSLLLQIDRKVANAYQCWGTPGAVLINPDGNIASKVAQGADAIRDLALRVARRAQNARRRLPEIRSGALPPRRAELAIGEVAPTFELPDDLGNSFTLDRLLGQDLLLVSWNPDCGFCRATLPDLQVWDADPPAGAPTLVILSSGSRDSIVNMQMSSLILSDEHSRVSALCGLHCTPMAIRIDSRGRIASGVIAGGQAILEMTQGPPKVMR
jgi:thiol-disulfide isomerase/thioredoxin